MSFSSFISSLPPPHPFGPFDLLIAISSIFLVQLTLVSDPALPYIKLIRQGIITPLVISGYIYCSWWGIQKDREDIWGGAGGFTFDSIKALELLVSFPAEEHVYRLKQLPSAKTESKSQGRVDGKKDDQSLTEKLIPEPVPPPWTFSKLWWAMSLWWSWRGIGWNYSCPLPAHSRQHPYLPSSRRSTFFLVQTARLVVGWMIWDLARSFMNVSSAAPFFSALPGAPSYQDLRISQKVVYSSCIAIRIAYNVERSNIILGLIGVSIGGVMGWEGEFWSPWGWPPVFGNPRDVWEQPGLSAMWSKVSERLFTIHV